MAEVIEKKKAKRLRDSCVVEIPRDFAISHGFPERSFVSLTLRNGKLVSEIIPYDEKDELEIEGFLSNFPKFDEEMKRIGDGTTALYNICRSRQVSYPLHEKGWRSSLWCLRHRIDRISTCTTPNCTRIRERRSCEASRNTLFRAY